jgi:hypothetical protein
MLNLSTVEYNPSYRNSLIEFGNRCKNYNYKNNESLEAMRLDWCLSTGGQFFLTLLDNEIISVSGCHPLSQVDSNLYRVLFRGVVLKEYQNLLGIMSKTHMTSIPFYYHLPLQLQWAKNKGYESVCITTNWNNPDGIESMSHSHKVMQLLARQGIVECFIDKINLYYTDQTVWKLNVDRYFKVREEFRKRHGLH